MRCDGVKALVVDDEPMNLNVAKGIFKRYGMEVSTANSGEEAIEMCRTEDYELIFMDHMMPGMDGVEAMKRIRYDAGKNRRDFSIIALTANALSTAREMFIAEGFDGFVSKPIELIELERVLKKVLPKSLITYEYIGTGYAPAIEEKPAEEPVVEKIDPDAILNSAGINIESGVGYCAGDREFYNSVISEYAGEAFDKKSKLDTFLADKDMKNYAIAVHAIKSTSLMIGAASLSEKAKALEHAAKAEDIEFVENGHSDMVENYIAVAQAISKALGLDSKMVEEARKAQLDDTEDGSEVLEFYPEQ
jgi:CheY-like chemotaxis protein